MAEEAKPKKFNENTKPANTPVVGEPSDMPMWVAIDKDQAKTLSIGDMIRVVVRGEVSSIRERMNVDGKTPGAEVELKAHKIEEVSSNSADMALKKMAEQP